MACAQTGSGKTAGFLFPVITMMLRYGAIPAPMDQTKSTYISALILAPTRELASQIFDEARKFCYCTGIRPMVVYGGADMRTQQRELEKGADLLVATPGRLVDLIERGRIRLACVRFLILDEADRMYVKDILQLIYLFVYSLINCLVRFSSFSSARCPLNV